MDEQFMKFDDLLEKYRQTCILASWIWDDYNNKGISEMESYYNETVEKELRLRKELIQIFTQRPQE